MEPEADDLDQRIAYVRALEEEPEEYVRQELYGLDVFAEVFPEQSDRDARLDIARRHGISVPEGVDPGVLDYLFGDRRLRHDREVRRIADSRSVGPAVPVERTIGSQIDRYLALQRQRSDAGQVSVHELDVSARCLRTFRDWLGSGERVDIIDADRLEGWYLHVLKGKVSIEYKKKRMRYAKWFIRQVP
jgi:hypothetical protein